MLTDTLWSKDLVYDIDQDDLSRFLLSIVVIMILSDDYRIMNLLQACLDQTRL